MKTITILFTFLLIVGCATTQKTKSSASSKGKKHAGKETASIANPGAGVTCTWNKEVRVIEQRQAGAGCEVIYTKNGNAETVGSAKNNATVCRNIASRIQSNLESNGFSCK